MSIPIQFMEYFRKNYPGPHTVITDPNWHAPKIYRAAIQASPLLDALKQVVRIAGEARDSWDGDQDMRVGKILIALSGKLPGYRADIDSIHEAIAREDIA